MRRKLTAAAVVAAFLSLCLSAGDALDAARGALVLCADTILPSLFPFFVLSILFSRLGIPRALGRRLGGVAGRLFGVSGAGIAALPIGLLGGYPMGAACIAELLARREIDEAEAERLLLFANTSGPAFLIGGVGAGTEAVFGDVDAHDVFQLDIHFHSLFGTKEGLLQDLRAHEPGSVGHAGHGFLKARFHLLAQGLVLPHDLKKIAHHILD